MRRSRVLYLPRHTLEYYIFRTHKQGGALSVILYLCGHVWLGAIFSSTQTAVIFSDKDISKCSYNLFLVVERTNRIILASFIIFIMSRK